MLLPSSFGWSYLIATGGVGILALIVAGKFLETHPKQKPVLWVGRIGLGLAVVGLLVYWMFMTRVIRIVESQGNITTQSYIMMGSSSVEVAGKKVDLPSARSGTVIVNEVATIMAYVEVREYGSAASSPPKEIMIGPNSAEVFESGIDLIGPENSPPSSVSSKSSSEIRCWLTWQQVGNLPEGMDLKDLMKDE